MNNNIFINGVAKKLFYRGFFGLSGTAGDVSGL